MQKTNVFYSLSISLACSILFPASSNLTAFERCEKAVEEGDLVAFQSSFSQGLLQEYKLRTFPDEPSQVVPISIAHVVATSKHPNAGAMIDYMVQSGFDPEERWSVWVQDTAQSGVIQPSEHIECPLALDVAVFHGSIPAVNALLKNGAGAYTTSKYTSWLKTLLCRRFGENPLTHADAYARRVGAGEKLPGTVDEYQAIAVLLEQAQHQEDLDDCSIQ